MTATIGEWYKLITPKLDDGIIPKRKLSSARILARLQKAKPPEILNIVALAVELFTGELAAQNPSLSLIVDDLLEDDPYGERDTITASLDPRVCAAFSITDYLTQEKTIVARRSRLTICANAVVSALRHRGRLQGHYLAQRCGTMLDAAEAVLDKLDAIRRDRKELAISKFEEATESGTASTSTDVKALVAGLKSEMQIDREELQALWWVFSGYSYLAKKPVRTLDLGVAALFAGTELAEIVQPPSTAGLTAIAKRMIANRVIGFKSRSR